MSELPGGLKKNEYIKKIRSEYIIKKIFENLEQNRLINVIHYNKKYQKLMNIKLKDYKNKFSKIEIEIIPKENTYGKFINIYSQIIKPNIHIYFNDSKEETNKNEITKDDKVTKIKIIIDYKAKSLK